MTNINASKRMLALVMGSAILLPLNANAAPSCGAVPNAPDIINFVPDPTRPAPTIQLKRIGTYRAGYFNGLGSEMVAYDPGTLRLFVINEGRRPTERKPTLDVLNIHDPSNPTLEKSISLSSVFGAGKVTIPTSVAVKPGIVAVTVYPADSNDKPIRDFPGKVLFYNTNGVLLTDVEVGHVPDMVIFTPNGQQVLVANTGIPPFTENNSLQCPPSPNGSVSIIDITGITSGVKPTETKVDFSSFDNGGLPSEVRIPTSLYVGCKPSNALSPSYIAVPNDSTAWVSLEVNNALAVVDIMEPKVTKILPFGTKSYWYGNNKTGSVNYKGEVGENRLDASDRDSAINIRDWPLYGMYQPDGVAAFVSSGNTYLVTANEGASFSDEERSEVGCDPKPPNPLCDPPLKLDPFIFGSYHDFTQLSDLQLLKNLGRLRVTKLQDYRMENGTKVYEKLYTFGARSFSIWSVDEMGETSAPPLYDSGDDFEQITTRALTFSSDKSCFNTEDTDNAFDNGSRKLGPEADGVTVGQINGRHYAFVVLVRPGGIMVYDITDLKPVFQQYINNRNFKSDLKSVCGTGKGTLESPQCAQVGDLGPEGVLFLPPQTDSLIKVPLLVTANQTSSSTTLYSICAQPNTIIDIPSNQVSISRGGFRYNRGTKRFVQMLTLTNASSNPIPGPISLALDALSNNAKLYNPEGKTACLEPLGNPYIAVNVGTDNIFSPGESTTVVLEFENPSNQGITYNTRLLAGVGDR